ncbi:MAG: GrpB family protein [Gaiellaceae bacterium]
MTEPGSDLWRERLAFRDALRGDPALVDEYEALKLLAREHADDVTAYTRDKRACAGVPASVGIQLRPRKTSPSGWSRYLSKLASRARVFARSR